METVKALLTSEQLWSSVAVVLVTFALWLATRRLLERVKKRSENSKAAANIRLFGNGIRGLLLVLAALAVLQINGINITSWLAGLGVVGIIVGFALQDILKDLIMGINIVVDHYYSVGDVVSYNGTVGEVVYLSIRVTKIRDPDSGNVLTVSNRNISEILRIENRMVTRVALPYGLPAAQYEALGMAIVSRMENISGLSQCTYQGIDSFDESAVTCVFYAVGDPKVREKHRRAANLAIAEALEQAGVEIPFRQVDIHIDDMRK